jgi:hypothetical protein
MNSVDGLQVVGVDQVFLTENAPAPGSAMAGSPALKGLTSGFLQLNIEPRNTQSTSQAAEAVLTSTRNCWFEQGPELVGSNKDPDLLVLTRTRNCWF